MHTVPNKKPSKIEVKEINPITIIAVCEEKDMDGNTISGYTIAYQNKKENKKCI